MPGVVGALTGVTRVLRSNRKVTFKISSGENYYYKSFSLSQNCQDDFNIHLTGLGLRRYEVELEDEV